MGESEARDFDLRVLYRIRDSARRRLEEGNVQARPVLMAVEELIEEREGAPLTDASQRDRMRDV